MDRILPVGEDARAVDGVENPQPVALDGVVLFHRFPQRLWRIRHTVSGHRTGTDRSQQGNAPLRSTNRTNPADRLEKITKGVDR